MIVDAQASPASLAQRTGLALAKALRLDSSQEALQADGRIRQISDLLIDGVAQESLPDSLDRTRLKSPQSSTALAVNSFLPWQRQPARLQLAGSGGFQAIQFEVRCPTGLRGTPPHLDLLGLGDQQVVAVTVRCTEYLSRRRAAVAPSYDRLLAETPGLQGWQAQLQAMRDGHEPLRHVDFGALVKHALALGRTFPDRPATLLYLYWEPLDAEQYEEFRRHRRELALLAGALRAPRVAFIAQSFEELWREWAELGAPPWLAGHVERLRARYSVRLAPGARVS